MTNNERLIDGVRREYELIDVAKESGELYNVDGIVVDADSEELALVYSSGTAEILSFDKFDDGEIGMWWASKVLETEENS